MFNRSQPTSPITKKLFLEDRPLKNSSGDKFQYTQVAEVICDVLEQNNFPVHIGLFGPWGSGKTSVIKLLENKINSDTNTSEKYLLKTLSVWKFADDAPSLHRKIVRQVQAELGVVNEEGLSIESSNTDTAMGSGIFALFIKNKSFRISAIFYILFLVAIIVTNVVIHLPRVNAILLALISPATFALGIGALKIFLGNFQITSQVGRKTLALLHSDQYEARFEASVEQYLKKNNGKKLILVFDDLDRLPPKQLLAALNTIKTFLHSSNCAFILPCDETVLRNGIKIAFEEKEIIQEGESQKSDESYVSDFMSKTFDYIIHLPIVEQRNMKTYARELVTEQQLSWIDEPVINLNRIMGVLIHSETKTPRQVKTLINSFVANWELAKKRDNESGIKLLTKEPQAIAMFTVLQTDYPDYYESLIKDPYLITRNDNTRNQDNLKAYLSRVEKFIPKNDPRPFIYFSNEKLNPATGKPDVQKVMNFLVNGQVSEFKNSFSILTASDKEILFSSAISDLNDNPGIEVENCLKSLIESEVDLSEVVSDMELHNWDLLLRENIDCLVEHIPSKVCNVLNYLSYDNKTWRDYGSKLNVVGNLEDLIELWVNHPSSVEKFGIQNLGEQISNSKIEDNDGYTLIQRIFDLNEGHSMLSQIEWIKVIEKSLQLNYSPDDYTFEACIKEINNKTDSNITANLLNHFLDLYDFKTEAFIDGIGKTWCSLYSGTVEEIGGFIQLFANDSFSGFDEEDLSMINSFMKNVTYNDLRDLVNEYLSEEDEEAKINKYLSYFPDSPGIPGFCVKNFNFELDSLTLELYLSVIVNRHVHLSNNNLSNVIKNIKNELNVKASQQKKSNVIEVINTLQQVDNYKKILFNIREELLSLSDKNMWFNWGEEVFVERLDLFFILYKDDESAMDWMLECVDVMVNIAAGYYNPGLSYSSNSSRYLNILISQIVSNFIEIDWENTIISWKQIRTINSNGVLNLFSQLDSITRPRVIGELSNRCDISSTTYNELLKDYYDLAVNNHREAVFNRWEVISKTLRNEVILKLSQQSEELVEACNKLLIKQLNNNPQVNFLNEFVEWDLQEKYRKIYLTSLIKNMAFEDCISWTLETIGFMNREGFQKWKGFSIEYAAEIGKVHFSSLKSALETALDLGQERAKLALTVLSKVDLSKSDLKYFREKIIRNYNEFPELVNHFGYRFKL
ncbi:P-loop NTPase fold protein [Paenibacillus sp. FSL L8-0709]|uniref:P-loop NTPase fold protein n=1 Tax=Paenibacillus sp. FSL L8-0709 TaxID=2975312 RepID=UPI0030F7F38D